VGFPSVLGRRKIETWDNVGHVGSSSEEAVQLGIKGGLVARGLPLAF
jgi:hypothetical protein